MFMSGNTENTKILRILIIDDNSSLLKVFAKMLRIKGFFVSTENTLKNGLKRLEHESYHVVFVDVPIDGYDENQVLSMLKNSHTLEYSSVILFSSLDIGTLELEKWKKLGLHSYIKKPVKRKVILDTINTIYDQTNFDDFKITSEKQVSTVDTSEYVSSINSSSPDQFAKLEQLQTKLRELELQQQKPEPTPETVPEQELAEEEATPDQFAKLEQLQTKLRELELQQQKPEPTPETVPEQELAEEEATPDQFAKLEQLQTKLRELELQQQKPEPTPETVPEQELAEEEATPDQFAKLEQLQTKLRELELQQQKPEPTPETVPEQDDKNISDYVILNPNLSKIDNILFSLTSLKSKFIPISQKNTSVISHTNTNSEIQTEMSSILSQIHDLKKQVKSLDDVDTQDQAIPHKKKLTKTKRASSKRTTKRASSKRTTKRASAKRTSSAHKR